jgi:hypothetical protein
VTLPLREASGDPFSDQLPLHWGRNLKQQPSSFSGEKVVVADPGRCIPRQVANSDSCGFRIFHLAMQNGRPDGCQFHGESASDGSGKVGHRWASAAGASTPCFAKSLEPSNVHVRRPVVMATFRDIRSPLVAKD